MQVLWSEDAELFLLSVPPADADRIIDAMVLLAETGRGFVRRMLGSPELRLYIEGYVVTFEVDAGVAFVLRIRTSARTD